MDHKLLSSSAHLPTQSHDVLSGHCRCSLPINGNVLCITFFGWLKANESRNRSPTGNGSDERRAATIDAAAATFVVAIDAAAAARLLAVVTGCELQQQF